MRILFLQNTHNAIGGISNVNMNLGNAFHEHGDDVFLYSLRNGISEGRLSYPETIQTKLINDKERWDCPRYSDAIRLLKKGAFIKACSFIRKRRQYDKKMKEDFDVLKQEIEVLQPDIIIVSHYELFEGIPKKYLNKTISHYHTNFQQLQENRGQRKLFKKYRSQLASFVWLTKATTDSANAFGISNSTYIYNPLRFSSLEKADVIHNKKVVFVGRLSPEKRLPLLISMFQTANEKIEDKKWSLDIYGSGEQEEAIIELCSKDEYIQFKGVTSNPQEALLNASIFMLTSQFEGFPLVVIEANECGVPCIAFDFGESSKEVIQENTGFIIPQDEENRYLETLQGLMKDTRLCEQLGNEAKNFAKSFHIDNIVKQWYTIFDKMRK